MFFPAPKAASFYQRNVLLETAVVAFGLGVVSMASVFMMVHAYTTTHSAAEYAFGTHLLIIHVTFHFSEFVVAVTQRPREAHPAAFMVCHSPAYLAANAVSLLEFLVEVFLVPDAWKPFSKENGSSSPALFFFLFRLNMAATTLYGALALLFYAVRIVAMLQCGRSFSLMVASDRGPEHQLVRTGLYALLRHPAYFGWFWRCPLSQMMLANPVTTVVHTVVTWLFFRRRIPFEEGLLLREDFFGEEYQSYKASTIVGIPFINT